MSCPLPFIPNLTTGKLYSMIFIKIIKITFDVFLSIYLWRILRQISSCTFSLFLLGGLLKKKSCRIRKKVLMMMITLSILSSKEISWANTLFALQRNNFWDAFLYLVSKLLELRVLLQLIFLALSKGHISMFIVFC